jgi:hypothetical protein
MGQNDTTKKWRTVKLPVAMVRDIDRFVLSELALKNGISSRTDLLTRLIGTWLSKYGKDYRLFDREELVDAILNRELTTS